MTRISELSEAEQHQWLGTKMSLFDQVDRVFQVTPIVMTDERGFAAAEQLVQAQRNLLCQVAGLGFDCLNSGGVDAREWSGNIWLDRIITSSDVDAIFHMARVNDGSAAIHRFSQLIDLDAVADLEIQIEKTKPLAAEFLKLGSYILAKLLIALGPTRFKRPTEPGELQLLIFEGFTLVQVREAVPAHLLRITDDSQLFARQENFRNKQREMENQIVRTRNELEEIGERLVNLSEEPSGIRIQIDHYRNEAASALAAFREQIGLKETNQLWGRQARHGKVAYYSSLFVLLAIMCGVPILGWTYRMEALAYIAEIEKAIRENGDASAVFAAVSAASRLILVTAPLALAVWAIKLIVRFNLRSMLLMDDAEQRVTMLNTYLFLVDKGAATTADRGALLEAMFRRAPGHGADTIEPPNLTDIMKYGDAVKG